MTVFVQKLGRDKFIEYITNYDNYGLLVGVGGAFLFMFAYYSPKDAWSAVFSERDDQRLARYRLCPRPSLPLEGGRSWRARAAPAHNLQTLGTGVAW